MLLKQLSVFLENKPGRITQVTKVLDEIGVNITAFNIADTSEFGILRMIVDNIDVALQALKAQGFSVRTTQVVGLVVPHQPGGMHQALEHVDKAGIEIEYMYAFAYNSKAAVIIKADDTQKLVEVLSGSGYHVLQEGELIQD
ncbi:ACT domain-containing protein [Paludibacter sp.]|uniref:ACT domain-containing protein n=1 Tax=Paludibacter sp. TaxID=1898105 RepID=UPI001353CDA3|nr:ACT domain-containing protein [Paludibacter sp.]MTK51962.1 acetolactate synthase [Paludibacter sp.]